MGRLLLTLFACLACSGCAIAPAPEDYSGLDSVDIVDRLRCELHDAIKSKVSAFLARETFSTPETLVLGERLRTGDLKLEELLKQRMPPIFRAFLEKYSASAVAYDFTFNAAEINNVGGNANFFRAFTPSGSNTLGFTAANNRTRQNVTAFRTVDTFGGLVDKKTRCEGEFRYSPNYIYPITGSIGLAKKLDEFIELNERGNLSNKDSGKVPTITHTLTFTTELVGSANAGVSLPPGTTRILRLASAGIGATASRKDIHEVIIGFSLPPTSIRIPAAADTTFARLTGNTPGVGSAVESASAAVSNQKLINTLSRFSNSGLIQ